MDKEVRHLFIEIETKDGAYDATLSDDSIDRDNEFFAPDVIKEWGAEGGTIPFLADHVNKMSSLVGGWTNRRVIEASNHFALKMEPKFFSSEANPLATQIKNQIDEAKAMGLRVGVSIGFIPISGHIDTKTGRYMHTKAELLEGSAVPVQSNRHASISLAKAFALSLAEGFKKTSVASEIGGSMTPTLEELQNKSAALEKENAELKAKNTELDTAQKADVEKRDKEILTLNEKIKTIEDTNTKTIEDYKAKLAEATKKAEMPKGKMPGFMVGPAGAAPQTKEKKFDATKAYLMTKGIDVDKAEGQ